MNFKVYVAGLYLPAKSADAEAVIASPGNKVLELVFLRSVDRETIQEAWQEGFDKNCKAECESAKDSFKAFNETMVDVSENSRLKMTFDKDGVAVDIKGTKNSKKAQVIGEFQEGPDGHFHWGFSSHARVQERLTRQIIWLIPCSHSLSYGA